MPETTKITEKELFERRNTSDVFNRLIIAGMLKVLNRKLVYEQVWKDETDSIENITVPFFYAFNGGAGNAERFIQDNYTFFSSSECTDIGLKRMDGNFDFLPQGRIELQTSTIDSGSITNRFVLGRYTRRVDGRMKSFVSFLYSIPLTFTFNAEIRVENMNTAFKIEQAFREYFYKNKTFYVNYRGTRVPCRVGFPDNNNVDRGDVAYQFGVATTDRVIKLTMSLVVETYQPMFDPTTEMDADSIIRKTSLGTYVNDGLENSDLEVYFRTTDIEHSVIPAGIDLYLEWDYRSSNDNNTHLYELYYYDKLEDKKVYIDNNINNSLSYIWKVPDELGSIGAVDVIIPNVENCLEVYKQPRLRIAPDPETKLVSAENVTVLGKGYFITLDDFAEGCFSYLDPSGRLREHPFSLNLKNGMIDPDDPIRLEPFVYLGDIRPRNIEIILENVSKPDCRAVLQDVTIV